jgi:D-alanine-D-alanine ligase
MEKKVVAVIFGGKSSEHEVSKMSAATIMSAMDEKKYFILPVYITKQGHWYLYDGPRENIRNLTDAYWDRYATPAVLSPDAGHRGIMRLIGDKFKLMNVDVIFPVLHGRQGEDGTVQGLFELCGIPYVGNGVLASAVAMDKAFTNMVAEKIGIKQPAYKVFYKKDLDEDINAVAKAIRYKIGYPCFVKPANTGSSVGISMASGKKQLVAALLEAARHDDKIIVEKRAVGRELECSVLGSFSGDEKPKASGVGEITYEREFYCYDAKYHCEDSQTIVSPELPDNVIKKVQEISLKIYNALDCRGLARVDFFYTIDGEVLFNEINTMPGFTSISMYPMLWKAAGMEIAELVDELIRLAN